MIHIDDYGDRYQDPRCTEARLLNLWSSGRWCCSVQALFECMLRQELLAALPHELRETAKHDEGKRSYAAAASRPVPAAYRVTLIYSDTAGQTPSSVQAARSNTVLLWNISRSSFLLSSHGPVDQRRYVRPGPDCERFASRVRKA